MKKVVIRDCTVYHGDCLEMLETVAPKSVAAAIVDPPYGVRYLANNRKVLETQEMLANDEKPHLEYVQPIVQTVRDGGAIYLCTRFDVSSQWVSAMEATGVKMKNPIFWVKDLGSQGDLLGDRSNAVEIILFAHVGGRHLLRGKRVTNAWTIPRPECNGHPTPKPPELIKRLILASSDPGDLILDCFLGSGTCAVACVLTGRKFIGCEIERKYLDLACERIEAAYREVDSRLPGFEPVTLEQGSLFE